MGETQEGKKQIDKKKIGIIGAICAVIIIALIAFLGTKDLRAYNSAKKLLENGNYQEAQKIFKELDDYKDSKEQVYECDYQRALSLIKEEKYSESLEIFTSSLKTEYKDSEEQKNLCIYEIAKQDLDAKNYIEAETSFKELSDIGYKDSNDLYKKSKYELGKSYMESESYEDAIECFANLNYEDSETLYQQSAYILGKKYLEEKDYDEALNYLEGLHYEDSDALVDSVLNGEYSLNKFIERYNAMADTLQEAGLATIKKLDAKNASNNQITTGCGATIYFNRSSDEEIDCRYEIISYMWEKSPWIMTDADILTGEWYCVVAAITPNSTFESAGNIIGAVIDSDKSGLYCATTVNNVHYNSSKTKSTITTAGNRNWK
ncbi:MAG: hypothetical protein HFH23_18335 [Ruminococcus sp.]|jgi:tetratricopeptide (TPR) repeat protein|nr:hypothetical protein [Ruminococcus sp.]